ncbi:MAG: hypothetical protein LBP95_05040 [Deltaproteobacteria bacterium]|jgi:hypothetical protein|nr:hypothetical protein [Deltaproteobacteria bacterium]
MADPGLPGETMVLQETRLINEVSLVLAEKRTALSVMRTGLAILVLPLSVTGALIGVSRYYDPMKVVYLLAPVLTVNVCLTVFGLFLIYRSWKRTRALEKINMGLKERNPNLRELSRLIEGGYENDLRG